MIKNFAATALLTLLFLSPALATAQESPLTGEVKVTSSPAGIPAVARGPHDFVKSGETPFSFTDGPAGQYTVIFVLPRHCPQPSPFVRDVDSGKGFHFTFNTDCVLSATPETPDPLRIEDVGGQRRTPPRREHKSLPPSSTNVDVLLTSTTAEVMAGGSIRMRARVRNGSNRVLRDLVMDVRFPQDHLRIEGSNNVDIRTNQVRWIIPTLAPGVSHDEQLVAYINDDLPTETKVSLTAFLRGEDVLDTASTLRSSTLELSVLNDLPETGWPLDLFVLLALTVGSLLVLSFGGATEIFRR